jgi:HD-GYP domain-containing protein (c-di-GMP phosphodiesterase class II)
MYSSLDYQEALLNASKGMIRVKDPVMLLKIITRFIDRKIGVTHVGVLLYDPRHNAYVLIDSKGEGGVKIPVKYLKVSRDNPIVRFFMQPGGNGVFARKEVLVLHELEHLKNFEILVNRKEDKAFHYEDIKKTMELLRTEVCVPSFYKKELIAVLLLGKKLSNEIYKNEEINLFVTLANDVAMAVKNAELIKELKNLYEKEHQLFIDTSVALATAIDARDRYTHGHSERVAHYSLVITKELIDSGRIRFDREFVETVQLSALLHDVGKIGIRDEILNKASKLTPEEFEIMKSHVTIGGTIVKPIKGLTHLMDGILYHHERFDGKGYPHGLKGEDIPLIGRIVNVADSYDTITTARSYKKAEASKSAIDELKRCAGSQFDPELVQVFDDACKKGNLTKRSYNLLDFSKLH